MSPMQIFLLLFISAQGIYAFSLAESPIAESRKRIKIYLWSWTVWIVLALVSIFGIWLFFSMTLFYIFFIVIPIVLSVFHLIVTISDISARIKLRKKYPKTADNKPASSE